MRNFRWCLFTYFIISKLIFFIRLSCIFFFFKQKTAYEMRISDWSSDVCSSDLSRRWFIGGRRCCLDARRFRSRRYTGWRSTMNWDQVEGNWKQLKGAVKEKWGRLTDDELDMMAGQRDQLIGRLPEHYGMAREAAEGEAERWGTGRERKRTSLN